MKKQLKGDIVMLVLACVLIAIGIALLITGICIDMIPIISSGVVLICMDIPTAIKYSFEVNEDIHKLKDEEVEYQ